MSYSQTYILVRIFHGSIPRSLSSPPIDASKAGGLFWGHSAIQIKDRVYGFYYGDIRNIHIFPKPHAKNCTFQNQSLAEWEVIVKPKRETCFHIPATTEEQDWLLQYFLRNLQEPEVDYSFFGERCASNTYHLLQKLHKIKGGHYMLDAFYPGALRRSLVRLSRKRGFEVTVKEGTPDRIWAGNIKSFPLHPWLR